MFLFILAHMVVRSIGETNILNAAIVRILLIHNDVLTKVYNRSLQQSWAVDLLSWDMLPNVRDPGLTGLTDLGLRSCPQ